MDALPVFSCVLTDDSGIKGYPVGTRCIWTHRHDGGPFLAFVINASGPNERNSLNLDIQYMAQKHIRWNWDAVTFNKNTFRYFSVLCTLRMSEHSGHYCIVMYKCNINVVMTTLIYLQALPWHAGISEVPGDTLLVTGSKPSALSPATPLSWPEPGGRRLLWAAKEKQVDSAVSPLLEQN